METSLLEDGEFWLPPEFLSDEDFLMEKENKVIKSINNVGGGGARVGLVNDGSKSLYHFETFGSLGLNSGLASPVESVVGSTETESDEEDFIAGLTRQMARSTLDDDFSGGFRAFPCDNNTKAWGLSGSPQSTLCAAGIRCGCRNHPAQNFQSRVPSPVAAAAAWDLYCAAAEEVARIRMNEEPYAYNNLGGRGLLGPPRKPSPSPAPVAVKNPNPNLGHGYYSHPSLSYQKLQATQFLQLKQQQQQQQMMVKNRQLIQNRGRVDNNNGGGAVGLSPSAWPSLQHAQQRRTGSGMRAVFLGNPAGKRESTGTGVFLPRRVPNNTNSATTESRKKPALSTVLVPTRVAEALNLSTDNTVTHPAVKPRFESPVGLNDAPMRYRNNVGGHSTQNRGGGGLRPEQSLMANELRLPLDWSY